MKGAKIRLFIFAWLIATCMVIVAGGTMAKPIIASAETPSVKLLARFCTYYGDSAPNRKSNVELACRKINGLVLYPEDEFSFNAQVGERTAKNGFKTAYIIQDGDFVEVGRTASPHFLISSIPQFPLQPATSYIVRVCAYQGLQ